MALPISSKPKANIFSSTVLSTPDSASQKGFGWKAFMQALGVLKEVSVVFPPLQAAASGLFRVLENLQEIQDARGDLEMMARRIETLANFLQGYEGRTNDEDMLNRLDGMTAAIEQQTRIIKKKLSSGVRNIITRSPDTRDIVECMRAVSFLISIFEMDSALNAEVKASDIKNLVSELHDAQMLEKLCPAPGACYDDIGGSGECMPGTRVGVLSELMAWATDPGSSPIYLLTGLAGAGKSAIARSFARLLDSHSLLGATFFCSRTSETRSNVAVIIPSIAYHLALRSQPYGQAVIDAMKKAPGVSFNLRPPAVQFTTLVMQPLQHLSESLQIPLIVIIDALDECSGLNAVRDLVGFLIRSGPNPTNGVPLKFFVSSRPEPHIEEAFRPATLARRLRLRDVDEDIVTSDITKYLKRNLADVARRINCPEWPSDIDLKSLVHKTGELFIFASTTVHYLSGAYLSHNEIQTRLQNILRPSITTKVQTAAIDTLYAQILDAAWHDKEPGEKQAREDALATIMCLREPLSISAISGLLRADPESLKLVLADFHSVIEIPDSMESPVSIFHASFPDYMTDGGRSGHNKLDADAQHAVLALQCIKCMNLMLRRNLCGIDRGDSTSFIPADAVNKIPAHLRYASIYWSTHLSMVSRSTVHSAFISELEKLTKAHILHWLECLSILGNLHLAGDCLEKAILFASHQNCPEIQSLMDEVRRMVPQIFAFASIYPLEVYHSALEWLPADSKIRQTYYTRNSRPVLAGLNEQWDNCEQVFHQSYACPSIAFSPDGTYLVSSRRHEAWIWRVRTGQIHRRLLGHTALVSSVAFSPDGTCVGSGSADRMIRLWSVSTGEVQQELGGHSGPVWSVAFSPDGAHIASCSEDRTIRVWSIETGETERELWGHTDVVYSLTYSPDGTRIVSGSQDSTLTIWNLETGAVWVLAEGDSGARSVTFSPDGGLVASGTIAGTIRIWDTETHEIKLRIFVGSNVPSLSFSPDGVHIAHGGVWSFGIWNVATGKKERSINVPTVSTVLSIAFSPDGSRIAVASENGTIGISNIRTEEKAQNRLGHSQWVWSVAFSPDRAHVVSRARDIIRIWNVETGDWEEGLDTALDNFILPYDPFQQPESESVGPVCKLGSANDHLYIHSKSGSVGNKLWIWADYQHGITSSAFQGPRACFGYHSGRVVIVDLTRW